MTILFQVYKKIEINFMTLKISSNKYITIFYDYIKNIYIYLIIHIKYIYDINEVIKIFFKSKLFLTKYKKVYIIILKCFYYVIKLYIFKYFTILIIS